MLKHMSRGKTPNMAVMCLVNFLEKKYIRGWGFLGTALRECIFCLPAFDQLSESGQDNEMVYFADLSNFHV